MKLFEQILGHDKIHLATDPKEDQAYVRVTNHSAVIGWNYTLMDHKKRIIIKAVFEFDESQTISELTSYILLYKWLGEAL